MTMYEVLKASFAYDPRKVKSVEEAFEKYEGYSNAEGIKLCKTIDEAREALADIKVDMRIYDAGRYAEATVAYIESGDWEWDEDLREYVFCSGVDRWDFKAADQQKEENNTLRNIRKKYNLTQHQLADLTGIPFRTIQNWEGGQRKCPDYVHKLLLFYLANTLKNGEEADDE